MGYKHEQFAKTLNQNLQCPICMEIFKEPMTCNAGHTFCGECIKRWLERNKKCPSDNTPLNKSSLVPNLTVKGIIEDLDVYCHPAGKDTVLSPASKRVKLENGENDKGDEQNCCWTGKLYELKAHRKNCGYKVVTCPYENCREKVKRKELEKHKEKCKYKKVACYECAVDVLECKLQDHLENECPDAMVPCPNSCSTDIGVTKMKRSFVTTHIKLECSMALLDCPFADHGCNLWLLRSELDDHMKDEMSWHMTLLAQRNTKLQKELARTNACCADLIDLSNSYIWKIDNFIKRVQEIAHGSFYTSPTFYLIGCAWRLLLYPKGKDESSKDMVLILLKRHEPAIANRSTVNTVLPNSKVNVKYSITVLGSKQGVCDISFNSTGSFTSKTSPATMLMHKHEAMSPDYCDDQDRIFTIKCTISHGPI